VDAWASRIFVPLGPGGAVFASLSAVSLARGLSALSQFRWELPEHELFRRLKDDPHTAGETFSAKSAIVLLLILLSAHSPSLVALMLGVGPVIHQSVGQRILPLFSDSRIQGYMDIA
jgi:hypothetical protein